jgi:hypothetical protein
MNKKEKKQINKETKKQTKKQRNKQRNKEKNKETKKQRGTTHLNRVGTTATGNKALQKGAANAIMLKRHGYISAMI